MSSQLYNFASKLSGLVFRGTGLAAGVAILATSAGAFAQTPSPQLLRKIAQDFTQKPDVVIDNGSTTGTTGTTTTTTSNDVRFSCQSYNGQSTVMYHPQGQNSQSYPWATPTNLGGGWTPQRRCVEISNRLEAYRPDGLLEMRTGVENGYNTVCVTTEKVGGCRIVFTVPPGQDPIATRDRVFQNLSVADSGQLTQGVNTFRGADGGQILNQILNGVGGSRSTRGIAKASQGINLRPFLSTADGGTGEKLRGGVNLNRGRLNTTPATTKPRIFR